MKQRSERWLIVAACIVLYALAMALLTWAIRDPTKWVVDSLIDRIGHVWALAVVLSPPIALFAWAAWRDRHLPPVDWTPPKGPRWARYLGNAYLALLGITVVVVLGAIIRAG